MQNNRAACAAGRGALAVQIYPATAGRLARAVRRGAGRTVGNRWPDNHKPPDGAPDCAPRSISQQAQPLAGQSTSRRTVRRWRSIRQPCAVTMSRTDKPAPPSPETRHNRPPLRSMPPDGFAPVSPVRRVP